MEKGKRNGRFLTDQDEAMARYRMIKPFLEDGVPLPDLAERHGLSVRTARRWVKRYREHGVAGLQRQPRADLGNPRQLPTVLQGVIEALALQKPRLTIAAIHREVTQLAVDKHLSVPSYSTVYSVVRQLDPALVTLAHDGIKAYGEAFDLLYRREAKAANAIWQADHNILDVLLIDETGKARKPWLTVIIDDYSRVVCGTFLSFKAPCALHTALALRQAIWRKHDPAWPVCGIPQVLYTDHGSDFTSRHIEQVCADLKIRLVFSQSGQPRGRGRIERFFRTVDQLLLMHQPDYAPTTATQAPAKRDLAAFGQVLHDFILHTYHHRVHSATGTTPLSRWSAGGFLPQMPESLEQLDLLLLTVARPRKVQRDGIRFQGLRYLDPLLAAYVGETVTIRYDPRDLTELRVFHQDQFLCRAICQELAGETVSLQDIIKARRLRKRELHEHLRQRRSLLDVMLPAKSSLPETIPAVRKPEKPQKNLKRYRNN